MAIEGRGILRGKLGCPLNSIMLPVSDFRNRNKSEKKHTGGVKVKLVVVISAAASLLFFTQLVFANGLATDGQKIAQIEAEIQELEAENTNLKVEIAKKSSLASLSQKAQEEGFKKPSLVIAP